MSSFILKIIALVTMFCDHLSYALWGKFSFLNYIGRLAFPIFAFQLTEGFIHTRSKKNYLYRLFIFAIASQVPFMLFCRLFNTTVVLNIFFTLFVGLIALIGYENCKNKYVGVLLVACLASTADFLKMDYGAFGILMIFIFYIFKDKKIFMNLLYSALIFIKYIPLYISTNFYYEYLLLIATYFIPLILINLYNGKKGPDTKYFLYLFYPIHLILLYTFNILFIH